MTSAPGEERTQRVDIRIEVDSATPPYEQVRMQLAAQIDAGTVPAGTRLPTVRALAAELSLAPNTVARVYRELEEAQLIETRGRGGSFVSAAGDSRRQRALDAATEYARTAHALGLDAAEATRIVTAVIGGSAARP